MVVEYIGLTDSCSFVLEHLAVVVMLTVELLMVFVAPLHHIVGFRTNEVQ